MQQILKDYLFDKFKIKKNTLSSSNKVLNLHRGFISNIFAKIDHEILISKICAEIKEKKFIDLIKLFIKSKYLNTNGEICVVQKGIDYGNMLLKVLLDIYLKDIDSYLSSIFEFYYRDFNNIFVYTDKTDNIKYLLNNALKTANLEIKNPLTLSNIRTLHSFISSMDNLDGLFIKNGFAIVYDLYSRGIFYNSYLVSYTNKSPNTYDEYYDHLFKEKNFTLLYKVFHNKIPFFILDNFTIDTDSFDPDNEHEFFKYLIQTSMVFSDEFIERRSNFCLNHDIEREEFGVCLMFTELSKLLSVKTHVEKNIKKELENDNIFFDMRIYLFLNGKSCQILSEYHYADDTENIPTFRNLNWLKELSSCNEKYYFLLEISLNFYNYSI